MPVKTNEQKDSNTIISREDKKEHSLNKESEDKKAANAINSQFPTDEQAQEEKKASFSTDNNKPETLLKKVANNAGKAFDAVKKGAEKVSDISQSATSLAKFKYETVKLNNELEKLYLKTGEKLWQLKKLNKLSDVEKDLSEEFLQFEPLQKQIAENEKKIAETPLFEKK